MLTLLKEKKKTIGFIAQEVKEVIPNAYSIIKEFIPDEMRMITEPAWSQDAITTGFWIFPI